MEFSGKELVRGEPDASSFPSGGLRATFEARGYTAWDPTVVCVHQGRHVSAYRPRSAPTAARRWIRKRRCCARWRRSTVRRCACCRLFGDNERQQRQDAQRRPGAGIFPHRQRAFMKSARISCSPAERSSARSRPRDRSWTITISATIKPRVAAFMQELDEELWKLGVLAKTEHNEVAPAQHELAPIYSRQQTSRPTTTRSPWRSCRRSRNVTALSACCTKSPLPASTARASTTTGRSATDTGINLSRAGRDSAARTRSFCCSCARVLSGPSMNIRICCAYSVAHCAATTTASARRKRLRR